MSHLTNHVPDPRLLTAYAETRDGPLHRLNTWTKFAGLPILVVAVTVARGVPSVVAIYAATLGAYWVAGLPVRRLPGWYTLPFVFATTVGGPVALGVSGTPLVAVPTPFGAASLTDAGLATYLELLGRGLAVVTYSLALWMTTGYGDIAHVVGRTLPRPVDQVALLAYRFTFVMLAVVEELLAATSARGGNLLRDFWPNRHLYGRILGQTFVRAIDHSEALVDAMEARGYDGDLTVAGRVGRPPLRDLLGLASLALAVAAYAAVVTYGVVP